MKPQKCRGIAVFCTAAALSFAGCFPISSSAAVTEDGSQELQDLEEELQTSAAKEETVFSGFTDSVDSVAENGDVQFQEMPVSDCILSVESGAYCYTVKNTDRFYMNVPDGAVSKGPVKITFSSDQLGIYSIEHDGVEDPDVLARTFEEEGTYTLYLYYINTELSAASADSVGMKIPVTFQIRNEMEQERRAIQEPTGFYFQSVTVDKQEMPAPDSILIPDRDGTYEIVFAAKEDPEITYAYSVTVDTTAPELGFSKDIENGEVWAPVTYETKEADSEVRVYRDYREYEFPDKTLTRGGSYRIAVTDPAGNTRTYSFQLKENPAKKIAACIAAGAVILAGIAVYMRYLREHMNIL